MTLSQWAHLSKCLFFSVPFQHFPNCLSLAHSSTQNWIQPVLNSSLIALLCLTCHFTVNTQQQNICLPLSVGKCPIWPSKFEHSLNSTGFCFISELPLRERKWCRDLHKEKTRCFRFIRVTQGEQKPERYIDR